MDVIGVIPARYGSVRFEGKLLADLLGKPVIQHVWENALKARTLNDLVVACDDDRIYKAVVEFGGKAVMTAKGHASGTERILEVVSDLDVKVVVNIQGDEPLLDPKTIDLLVDPFLKDERVQVVNLMEKLDDENEVKSPNNVKVVFDLGGNALYYSRLAVPNGQAARHYKQLGLYAFSREAIVKFAKLKETPLEIAESDDMLRFVENGINVKMVLSPLSTEGVDTPADHVMVAELMAKDELFKKYRDK